MTTSRRRRLIARARATLRPLTTADRDITAQMERLEASYANQQARLDALESLVEGLQDAVHRETIRLGALIDELQKKTEPGEIARALSDDARRRGL
jgi:uncharacterized coiled-coil protein SlyX